MNNPITNNIQNVRQLTLDNIYCGNYYNLDGVPFSVANSTISTKNFLLGVSQTQAELGFAYNSNQVLYEGYKLNSFLNNYSGELTKLGINPDEGMVNVIVETSSSGYLIVEDRVNVPRNVSLTFRCPVLMGYHAQFYFTGLDDMIPANYNSRPYFNSNYSPGDSNFSINRNGVSVSAMALWVPGSLVRLRFEEEDRGLDAKIITCTRVGATDNYNIIVDTPLDQSLTKITDGVRKYSATIFSSNVIKGDSLAYVYDTTPFVLGDTVMVFDTRDTSTVMNAGNSNVSLSTGSKFWWSGNRCRHELKRIIEIDSVNKKLYFNGALVYDYDNPSTTYVSVLKPNENASITDLTMINYEYPTYNPPTENRINRHRIWFQKCVNNRLENIKWSDTFNFIDKVNATSNMIQCPNVDPLIRADKCYNCRFNNITLNRNSDLFTSSSIGYSIALFSCSELFFNNVAITGGRHSISLSGTNGSHFTNFELMNCFSSGLDLHGCGEDENVFQNFKIEAQSIKESLAVDNSNNDANIKELIQIGNSTHTAGSSYNKFMNFSLKYGNPVESNLSSVYGIQLIPRSSGNIFQNFIVENVDIAVYMVDSLRGRLNSNLVVTDNTFNDFTVKNCNRLLAFNGANSMSNSYGYISGTSTAYTSNTLVIDSNAIGTTSQFAHFYSNWTLIVNTSNYQVLDYNNSNSTITTSTNFAPALTSNMPFVCIDSNTPSIYPHKNIKFNNWRCYNIGNDSNAGRQPINLQYVEDVRINNCLFSSCSSGFSNSSNNYPINAVNVNNLIVVNNTFNSNYGMLKMINTSNATIVNNLNMNQMPGYSNTVYDLGANSNVYYNFNKTLGFVDSYIASVSTTYMKQLETYGYSNTPDNPAFYINNSNGCIGLGMTQPYAPISFKNGTNSKKICLYETSSNNSHQFYGFGVDAGSFLRYQSASSTTGGHYWMCATSSNASVERMRLTATGCLSIGSSTPSNAMLYIKASNALVPFVAFSGTVGTASNIDTAAVGAYYGKIMVNIIGVGNKFIPLYDS